MVAVVATLCIVDALLCMVDAALCIVEAALCRDAAPPDLPLLDERDPLLKLRQLGSTPDPAAPGEKESTAFRAASSASSSAIRLSFAVRRLPRSLLSLIAAGLRESRSACIEGVALGNRRTSAADGMTDRRPPGPDPTTAHTAQDPRSFVAAAVTRACGCIMHASEDRKTSTF